MTTQTLTLTDFLLARIAEDEEAAPYVFAEQYTPSRVLAECEAKRRIVDLCEDNLRDLSAGGTGRRQFSSYALQILAQPCADHPDFRDEWRP
jgi:hypothetical protein